MKKLFKKEKFDYVINLAAQAGVRMSIDKPDSYFDSNLIGFYNILKCCTNFKIKHLIAASSSSVYGEQKTITKERFTKPQNQFNFMLQQKKPTRLWLMHFLIFIRFQLQL